MSWAEDNGIDGYSMFELGETIENLWKKGEHKDKEGKRYKINEMTTEHLKNTIKFFEGYDTDTLKKELNTRI